MAIILNNSDKSAPAIVGHGGYSMLVAVTFDGLGADMAGSNPGRLGLHARRPNHRSYGSFYFTEMSLLNLLYI